MCALRESWPKGGEDRPEKGDAKGRNPLVDLLREEERKRVEVDAAAELRRRSNPSGE